MQFLQPSLRNRKKKLIKRNWELYLFAIIPVLWLLIFRYYPMYGNIIAFKRYIPSLGIWGSPWAGISQFQRFFSSFRFTTVLQNLLIASDDLPDVFMSPWGMNWQEVFTYGLNGTLAPITDYVETRMPNLKKALAEYPEYKATLYMPDGNVYALPTTAGVLHVTVAKKMYAYMPWLKDLGIDIPETTEDFRNMLIAFRDQDPNGNGKKDEIPLMGSTNGWQTNPIEFIMNSFIYTNMTAEHQFLMQDDGTVKFVANTPEWRKGLTYMADLVDDGLLAPETFVQQNDQLVARCENPDVPLVGAVPAGHFGVFTTIGGPSGRFAEYRSIPPVEGPDGVRQSWYRPRGVNPHLKITNAAQRPDIIAQWADFFYGSVEDKLLAMRFWKMGEEYRLPTQEEKNTLITRDGTPPQIIANLSVVRYGIDKYNDGWGRTAPWFIPRSWEALTDTDDPTNLEYRLMKASMDNHLPYVNDHWMPRGLVFAPEYSDEIADLTEAIASATGLVQQWSTEFIIGERDIRDDSEWNEYLDVLERAGVERYTELWAQRVAQTK